MVSSPSSSRRGREAAPGAKVLELLLVNRLIDPGSEFRLQRQWFDHRARGELLGLDFAVAEKDRLDRCLDPVLPHKRELFLYLRQRVDTPPMPCRLLSVAEVYWYAGHAGARQQASLAPLPIQRWSNTYTAGGSANHKIWGSWE